jgi:hypothetical protein
VFSTTTEKQHSTVEQQQQQQQQLGQQKQEVVSTTQSGTIFSGWFKEYLFVYTLLRQNVASHNVYVTKT